MNMAEAAAMRELVSRVTALEAKVKDHERRLDEQSKAHRIVADDNEKMRETLRLKKAG